jgi:hypothetical protein
MLSPIKKVIRTSLLVFFTLFSWILYLLLEPLFGEPHGFLVLNQLSGFSGPGFVEGLLFLSAAGFAIQGACLMDETPFLTAGMMSSLWATGYLLLWMDPVFAFSLQSQSPLFLISLALGILFIYSFFFILEYLAPRGEEAPGGGVQAKKSIAFLGGWLVFDLLLSARLAYDGLWDGSFQWPLALGFLGVGFVLYLLILFLWKAGGREVSRISRFGRILFMVWFVLLAFAGLAPQWLH